MHFGFRIANLGFVFEFSFLGVWIAKFGICMLVFSFGFLILGLHFSFGFGFSNFGLCGEHSFLVLPALKIVFF